MPRLGAGGTPCFRASATVREGSGRHSPGDLPGGSYAGFPAVPATCDLPGGTSPGQRSPETVPITLKEICFSRAAPKRKFMSFLPNFAFYFLECSLSHTGQFSPLE